MAMILDEKSLSKLREFLKTRNFTDKYFQTAQLVHKFDGVADIKKNLNVVKTLYEDLLYEYPFNFAFWSNFANFYINIQLYDTAVQIYDEAVSLNNTSPELWNLYITFVLQYYGNTDGKAIEVYERAIQAIQYDVNADLIWNSYLDFLEQSDPLKAHTLYWRAIDYPVAKPNEMIQRYGKFLHGLDHLQYLDFIESRKDLAFPPEANISKHLTLQLYTQRINHTAIINPPADSENRLSSLLERVEFNGEELDPIKDRALKSYLAKQKQVLNHEKLVYLHEKCLVAKCKSGDFWMKILHLLDKHHSTRYLVDEYLIKYEKLYSVIDKREQILFFQADIKERERDIVSCREIYKDLQKSGVFEAYLRHLYMEIRTLNIQYILEIFVSLCQSVKNPDQIMFVVQEMSETFKKLEELEKILVIVTQLEKKLPEYSRFFYLTWVNFLINCERPWEEIAGVFELAFAKVATDEDKQGLWRFYAYTTRRYCHDINVVREVEKRHAWRVEPGQELEGTETAKRLFGSFNAPNDYTVDEIVKKVKMG